MDDSAFHGRICVGGAIADTFFSVSTTVLPISEVYLRFYTGRTYLELSFLLGPEMIGVV